MNPVRQFTTSPVAIDPLPEEHFRHALRMVKLGYWWWHPATNELEWSDECFHMLGLDPATATAAMETYVNAIHPEDRHSVQQHMESVMVTGSAPDLEYRIVQPDGTTLIVRTRAEMVLDANQTPLYLFGTLQDITRQKQQEEALRRAMQIADSTNKAKSAFLSRMSHEFFTPLNAIVGFSQILGDEPSLDETASSLVGEVKQAAAVLTGMVKDILEYTYLESAMIDSQDVDLNIFLQDIHDCHHGEIVRQGQVLDIAAMGKVSLRTDPTRLKEILDQLIDNAIKYNRPNGRICLGVDVLDDKRVRIWVQDTGCGISAEFRSRLFKPFERQPQHDNIVTGSGLGLSICKRVSALLGGHMGYQSREAKGSRFWVDLPLRADTD